MVDWSRPGRDDCRMQTKNWGIRFSGFLPWLAGLCLAFSCSNPSRPSNDRAVDRAGGKRVSPAEIGRLQKVDGHRVYVPVYSHIYHQQDDIFNLTSTLSIRNTDDSNTIYVTSVKYYDTTGKLIRAYTDAPIALPPLSTLEYVIGANDTTGGSGANFIVEWMSGKVVTQPVIECVMVGTQSQQGVSFITEGKVLD